MLECWSDGLECWNEWGELELSTDAEAEQQTKTKVNWEKLHGSLTPVHLQEIVFCALCTELPVIDIMTCLKLVEPSLGYHRGTEQLLPMCRDILKEEFLDVF